MDTSFIEDGIFSSFNVLYCTLNCSGSTFFAIFKDPSILNTIANNMAMMINICFCNFVMKLFYHKIEKTSLGCLCCSWFSCMEIVLTILLKFFHCLF